MHSMSGQAADVGMPCGLPSGKLVVGVGSLPLGKSAPALSPDALAPRLGRA